ncbi:Hydroxysteroid dehydrogenase-like protein 2 [Aphelenchoides fujianensis]|nr:Hydroxysteroid dehydrogenase-like protein 2 [Aphelenchoides fujianensis]
MSMIPNTGYFKGKTVLISGASRGIGLAIAKKLAADGANIVIAAKTTRPHPKLPGTIYTAAAEVEAAGGRALPIPMDIRDEKQIQRAVDLAVQQFGGIDVLINNCSAISLTGTQQTDARKWDLMMDVNARGTYLLTRACLPHLMMSTHPHVLTISPPLSMLPQWFSHHCAYTISKYGMSMAVLGMAQEFATHGIAFNSLWPRTAVWTAAMAMLKGSNDAAARATSRRPEIMSDAAYHLLQQNPRQTTGRFLLDDAVLSEAGIEDLSSYAFDPQSPLDEDLFIPGKVYAGPQEFCGPPAEAKLQSKL